MNHYKFINHCDSAGNTALHIAINQNNMRAVTALLESNADPFLVEPTGQFEELIKHHRANLRLVASASIGSKQDVKDAIDDGADVNVKICKDLLEVHKQRVEDEKQRFEEQRESKRNDQEK